MANDLRYYRLALKVFADFTGAIAIPAVAGALLGKWLDTKYQTSPRYLFLMLIIAFSLTAYLIVKKAKEYREQIEKIEKL